MYEGPGPPDDRDAQRELLLREGLGDLGALGGRLGGPQGAGGGRLGARLTARLLPTRHHEETLELPGATPELAWDVLAHLGRAVDRSPEEDGVRVRGVVGAGALNMNPAVVDIAVAPGGRVTIHAAAKEGLIPQRTARGAVRRVIDSLAP